MDNYYIQVIATGTEWKEAISGIPEIASYRRNDKCSNYQLKFTNFNYE